MKSFFALIIFFSAIAARGESPICGPLPFVKGASDCAAQATVWAPPVEAQWSRDVRGLRSGIVNIYVHGNLRQLEEALTSVGWVRSFDNNKRDDFDYVHSVWTLERAKVTEKDKKLSPTFQERLNSEMAGSFGVIQAMPVSNEYLCGELHAVAFEKYNNPFGGRHHLRIWQLEQKDAAGQPILAVAASHDIGVIFDKQRPRQFFLNHRVERDTDLERDLVVLDLKLSGAVSTEKQWSVKFSCPAPRDGLNSTDQRLTELTLKN